MSDKYIVYNNKSQQVVEMKRFLVENDIPYITIYKDADSRARVFPPNNKPSYDERSFSCLKRIILEERIN